MAANPLDLTTLASTRELLQTPAAITLTDELLQTLITEASVMLQDELGCLFTPAETAAAKSFAFGRRGVIDLRPWNARTVTAVTFTAVGGSAVTVTAGRWQLKPISAAGGVYTSLRLHDYRTVPVDSQTVTVTGNWGYAAVPADVARGCKITVKTWLREGAAFNPDGNVVRFERVGRVPQDVLDGLSHYRPVLVA